MPCNLILWNLLQNGYTSGGQWVEGYQVAGDCDTIVNTNPSGTGVYNPTTHEFNVDNAATGTYHYTYKVGTGPCRDCATITINVEPKPVFQINTSYCTASVNSTTGQTQYLCEETLCTSATAPPINLYTRYFNNTNTITPPITLIGTAGTGFTTTGSVTGHTFNPAGLGAGTYEIDYARQVPDGSACSDCRTTLKVKIILTPQGVAGNDRSVTICRA